MLPWAALTIGFLEAADLEDCRQHILPILVAGVVELQPPGPPQHEKR
jgi:hypothetical protein